MSRSMITGTIFKSRWEKILDVWKLEPQDIYDRKPWVDYEPDIDWNVYRTEYIPSHMQFMKPSDRLEYVMQIIGLIKGRSFIRDRRYQRQKISDTEDR